MAPSEGDLGQAGDGWVTTRDPADIDRIAALEAENEWLRYALRTIAGPADTGPLMDAYREAGGGYEGLQAIARLALTSRTGSKTERNTT